MSEPHPTPYIDATRGGLFVCPGCRAEYLPALPVPLSVYTAILRAWGEEHEGCCGAPEVAATEAAESLSQPKKQGA